MSFRLRLRRHAIGLALTRRAPGQIPLSDRKKVAERNYCSAYLTDPDHRYVLRYLNTRGARSLIVSKDDESTSEGSILNSGIESMELLIVQYYKQIEIRYDSAAEFILHQFFGFRFLAFALDWLQQVTFNGRRLHRRDRIEILRVIADATIKRKDARFSDVGILSELYGSRWVRHPGANDVQNYCRLILESLVGTGDLVATNHMFKLAPGGLKTLADYELEERRHRDNRARQTGMLLLTLVLAILGAVQVWQALVKLPG